MISIYTDGACSNNQDYENSIGGWAFITVRESDKKTDGNSGKVLKTTNNRMEIIAIIKALKFVYIYKDIEEFVVYSDSQYAIETLNGNYKIKKNKDLWDVLLPLAKEFQNIRFEKIKGHANNDYNNLVDMWAVNETKGKL